MQIMTRGMHFYILLMTRESQAMQGTQHGTGQEAIVRLTELGTDKSFAILGTRTYSFVYSTGNED